MNRWIDKHVCIKIDRWIGVTYTWRVSRTCWTWRVWRCPEACGATRAASLPPRSERERNETYRAWEIESQRQRGSQRVRDRERLRERNETVWERERKTVWEKESEIERERERNIDHVLLPVLVLKLGVECAHRSLRVRFLGSQLLNKIANLFF